MVRLVNLYDRFRCIPGPEAMLSKVWRLLVENRPLIEAAEVANHGNSTVQRRQPHPSPSRWQNETLKPGRYPFCRRSRATQLSSGVWPG